MLSGAATGSLLLQAIASPTFKVDAGRLLQHRPCPGPFHPSATMTSTSFSLLLCSRSKYAFFFSTVQFCGNKFQAQNSGSRRSINAKFPSPTGHRPPARSSRCGQFGGRDTPPNACQYLSHGGQSPRSRDARGFRDAQGSALGCRRSRSASIDCACLWETLPRRASSCALKVICAGPSSSCKALGTCWPRR